MADPLSLVIVGIVLALIFDFGNGFHDAANSIATVIATQVLSMRQAVLLAAACNFIAAFVFGVAVANTIGKGIVDVAIVTPLLVNAGLVGGIIWNYATVFVGIPVSSSHSLIGGLIGAAIAAVGFGALNIGGILTIVAFIFIAPIIGTLAAIVFSIIVLWIFQGQSMGWTNKLFRKLQLVSVSIYSLGHGTNDAQKTMGVISLLLFSAGFLGSTFYVPFWVVIMSHLTIATGTLFGGWNVVKTLGTRLTNLKPFQGFCAETGGALIIIVCSSFGIPVSTTHVISGAIAGVGLTRRTSAVRWKTMRRIVMAWFLTLPATAVMGFIAYKALLGVF